MTSTKVGDLIAVSERITHDARPSTGAAVRAARWPLLRRLLAAADVAAWLVVCLAVGLATTPKDGVYAIALVPLWIVIAKGFGLYDRDQRALRHGTLDELSSIVSCAAVGTAILALAWVAVGESALSARVAIVAWLIAASAAVAARTTARLAWRQTTPAERTLIVAGGELGGDVSRHVERFASVHVDVVGVRHQLTFDELKEPPPWLMDADRIIIGAGVADERLLLALRAFCRAHQVRLSLVPRIRATFSAGARLEHLADLPLIEYDIWHVSRSTMFLKRCLDVALCALALVVLLPLGVAAALAIRIDGGGPVFFTQLRAGRGGRPFRMLKFRTMVPGADRLAEPMLKARNDPRVTRVGRVLRRWSIDELPQLLNVLRGDMSLVGPRPEQVELVEAYDSDHRLRLAVRPGLTGPMQIYGRGDLRLDERLALERDYIETMSLTRDLRIVVLTMAAIVRGHGAY